MARQSDEAGQAFVVQPSIPGHELAGVISDGRLRTNIGNVATLAEAWVSGWPPSLTFRAA